MEKRKERSSRHRMKIDSGREGAEEDGTLLLANPMAGGEVSPHSVTSALPQEHQQPKAPLVVGKKSRPKSPSLLRFFVRGGGNRKASEEEETVDSAGSDHEDPFSVSVRGSERAGGNESGMCGCQTPDARRHPTSCVRWCVAVWGA